MIFHRVKSEGLAHNSYFLGAGGQAAVIDPRRDCQVYLDLAHQERLRITYIFETHRNEDYVVGSRELSQLTGAEIFHGPRPDWGYGVSLEDGQSFDAGNLRLTAVHTPGHTDESMSYSLAVLPWQDVPLMAFTGDALFIHEAGRTDLYGQAQVPRLAGHLWDSIFQRLLPMGDGVILCPAHGAGSVCGRNIADRDESTLGHERATSPILQIREKEEFVRYKVAEHLEFPPYFRQMERYNREGPPLLCRLPDPPALSPAEFRRKMEEGAVVVDANWPATFGGAHVPGALSIWLDGLPAFAGWLLPYDRPLLLVLSNAAELDRAVRYLIRLGYDNIAGYLGDGTEGWYNAGYPTQHLGLLTVHELKHRLDRGETMTVLDVREESEWREGHIAGVSNIYAGQLPLRLGEVTRDNPIAVLCSVGRRATVAAGILQRAGFPEVYSVLGSMQAWKAAGYPVVVEG